MSSTTSTLVTSFFSRLEHVCTDLEDKVRALEGRQVRASRRRIDDAELGLAAEAAEDILGKVALAKKTVTEINSTVKTEGVDTLASFLEEAEQRFGEMKLIVNKYENWAAQYGYTPQLHLELNLDDALAKHEEDQQQEQVVEQPQKEEDVPSVLDFGLSKSTLNKMGYKFKEDFDPAPTGIAVVEKSNSLAPNPTCSSRNLLFNSFADADEEEDTPPASILKKITTATEAAEVFAPETSRVEISPGLFVRKPKVASRNAYLMTPPNACQKKLCAGGKSTKQQPPTSLDSTPKAPELRTVNLQKLLTQARQNEGIGEKMVNKNESYSQKYQTPPPTKSNLENLKPKRLLNSDSPPKLPTMSSKKLRQLASSGKKHQKSFGNESGAAEDSEESSPGPPQPPQLSQTTLARLQGSHYLG